MLWLGLQRHLPEQVLRVAKAVRKKIIQDAGGQSAFQCVRASTLLVKALRDIHIDASIHYCADFCVGNVSKWQDWRSHTVVKYNKHILDVTADQFNQSLRDNKQAVRMKAIVYGSWVELQNRYKQETK